MADTQQEETPQRKTPAQKAAERKTPEAIEPETTPLDLLRQQAPTMGVAVLVVSLILVFFVYRSDKSADFDSNAWAALGELKASAPDGTDGYEELAKKYAGSEAEPYIRLTWASRLYAAGTRDKVEKSVEVYETILKNHPQNTFFKNLLPGQIEAIKAELSSDRAALIELAEDAPNLAEDDPTGMGDGHEGHDHGPGEGHDDE